MKQFFKTVFASALGMLLGFGILMLCLFLFFIGLTASMSSSPEYKPKNNTVFKLELTGVIAETTETNPWTELFGAGTKETALKDILRSIRLAKENDKIKGIYIETGMLSSGPATREAIRRALLDFKESGKFIYAYADYYTQGSYYIASVADSLFVNPSGVIELTGMGQTGLFYPGLAEKLGVELYIFKVGTFKSAVEPYMLNAYSEENREQVLYYMGDIWSEMTKDIISSRGISKERFDEFVNEGLALRKTDYVLEYGLADELVYKSDMEGRIKNALGIDSDEKIKYAGINRMVNVKEKIKTKKDKIAILYAEGEITESIVSSPFESNSNTITAKLAGDIRKLKDDEEVKAVVLRVNSPGGSAFTSEQIWKEVEEIKSVKPIVVSMGNYAASGGYYISAAASAIVAEHTTITGSIGVFGIVPNLAGSIQKLGVTTDVIKTSPYQDAGSFYRPMTENEKEIIQAGVEEFYDLFLTRCADGRGLEKSYIDSIGQGRVWTGSQALDRKLVDKLGGIETAIEEAALLAGLDEYNVIVKSNAREFFMELLEKQIDEIRLSFVKKTLGPEFELYQSIRKTTEYSGIQARLPFDLPNL